MVVQGTCKDRDGMWRDNHCECYAVPIIFSVLAGRCKELAGDTMCRPTEWLRQQWGELNARELANLNWKKKKKQKQKDLGCFWDNEILLHPHAQLFLSLFTSICVSVMHFEKWRVKAVIWDTGKFYIPIITKVLSPQGIQNILDSLARCKESYWYSCNTTKYLVRSKTSLCLKHLPRCWLEQELTRVALRRICINDQESRQNEVVLSL